MRSKYFRIAALSISLTFCFPAVAQYVAPPPEVIAKLTPVYHEGRKVYFYKGHWHYQPSQTGPWQNGDSLHVEKAHPKEAAAAKASATKAEKKTTK
jgi:hypothetical protein